MMATVCIKDTELYQMLHLKELLENKLLNKIVIFKIQTF